MKILMSLVISLLIFEVESANDSGWSFVGNPLGFARLCNGSDDITSTFEGNRPPELENSYSVYIQKNFPAATKIKLQFDADASVELHNKSYARISYEQNVNAFLIRFFRANDLIAFDVKGLTPGVVPYFKNLIINNVEYCQDPEVGYLDQQIEGYVTHAETTRKEPGNCGRRKVTHTELIVNGLATKAGDWPWHVALYRLQRSLIKYICGGTLITNFFVLTAAHCASIRGEQVLPEIMSVILGKFNLVGGDEGTQEKEVHQIIIHDQYNHRRLNNDIALLKLKTEVTFTDYVQPACLWYSKALEKLPTNEIFGVTVGWGFDISDTLSPQLKQAKMPIVSESACIKTNPLFYSRLLNSYKFCAGYKNGTSACNGDSGGAFQVFIPDVARDSDPKAPGAWGMTVTSGSVVLNKDEKNLIGISIGGGAPLCPCLYIVQIFDNTPASKDGTLQSGDELVGVNSQTVKGKTKVEVAKMIQSAKDQVTINYNKLHADPKQGKSLDIIMKKMKHRLVENMSTGTADALGLSRAILCNDTLVAKLNEMRETENTYKRLVEHAKRMLKSYFDLLQTYKSLGDIFASIGVREPQARASEAFTKFGQYHRLLERDGIKMLKTLKPILADMGTYLNKAIPDTKLTIRKYADTKFEYLSYCLKVKEMDDEEYGYNALQEPLYRVETGNYEYRLILRCRQEARNRFARLRSDVLVKLELLDNKKTQDVAYQLRRFIQGLAVYLKETMEHLKENATLFPVEVDLSQNAFQYKSTMQIIQDSQDDDEEIEYGKEIHEYHDLSDDDKPVKVINRRQSKDKDENDERLLPDLTADTDVDIDSSNVKNDSDNLTLLTELGLVDTKDDFGEFQQGLDDYKNNSDVLDKLLNLGIEQ